MKYRHYAPRGNLSIVEGEPERVISYINEKLSILQKEGRKTGVIATDETVARYHGDDIKSVGRRQDEEAIARHLFRILREFDDDNVEVMFTESFQTAGIGQAIMNRLLKAAGHQVIQV